MTNIRKLLDLMNENVSGAVATVSQPLMSNAIKRTDEDETIPTAVPKVIEYGNWANSSLVTNSKLKEKRKNASQKVVKSIYGEDVNKTKNLITESDTGDTPISKMTDKELADYLGCSIDKVKQDREECEEKAKDKAKDTVEEGVVDTLKKVGKYALDKLAPDDETLLKQLQKSAGIPQHAQHGQKNMAQPTDEMTEESESDTVERYKQQLDAITDQLAQNRKKYREEGMDSEEAFVKAEREYSKQYDKLVSSMPKAHETYVRQQNAKMWSKNNWERDPLSGRSAVDENVSEEKIEETKLEEDDIILMPGLKQKSGLIPHGKSRVDHEVEMAKSDLYQASKNATEIYRLIKNISEDEGIEGWVQEKIIKAADYLNTVREYLQGKEIELKNMHEMYTSEDDLKENKDKKYCPECGGDMYPESLILEKKDACYYKVKSRYKIWPSAYASGALVKCRKKGAKNWGTKS